MVFEHFRSDATQDQPLGWMSADDWRQTVAVLRDYGGLESEPPLDALYTNEFIPMQ